MTSVRAQIEDAIVERVSQLKPRIALVEPYDGEIGVLGLDEIVATIGGKFPGVLVTAGKASYSDTKTNRRSGRKTIEVKMVVADRALRSRSDAQRAGIGDEPGIFGVLDLIQGLLFGHDLGIDGVYRLEPYAEDVLFQSKDVVVWQVTYSAPTDVEKTIEQTDALITILRAEHGLSSDEDQSSNPLVTADTDLEA
jgi:phage gp37-like protein